MGPPKLLCGRGLLLKKPKNLDPSEEIQEYLRKKEDLRKTMETDLSGNCTIGYGHKIHDGKCGSKPKLEKKYKGGIDEEKAEKIFEDDLKEDGHTPVIKHIDVKLTQYQYDALVSFMFNLGGPNLGISTLKTKVENGADASEIKKEFLKWNMADVDGDGKLEVVDGLTTRRKQEAKLFTEGEYP